MSHDDAIAHAIFTLLDTRAATASICPSEVARSLAPDAWRPLMPRVRAAARALAAAGRLEVLQGGRVIAGDIEPRGPIRLARPRTGARGHDD